MNNSTSKHPIALVVIDLQAPFLKAVAEGDTLVQRCSFAIEAANILDIPVIVTEQVPEKLGGTIDSVKELLNNAKIFAKNAFSSFGAEGLPEWLAENGVEALLVCGLETPICVYQTVRDSLRNEMNVTLLTDAVSCRRIQDQEDILSFIESRTNASLLPSETVFYSLLGEATHPRFREFTALVKKYNS